MRRQFTLSGPTRSARSTGTSRFLLVASLLLTLSACSTVRSDPQTPRLQANLAADCATIAPAPIPFVDPARLVWEMELLFKYADCAAKHRHTVGGWPQPSVDID